MEIKIEETGYYHFNEVLMNRLTKKNDEEYHFYYYSGNRFPIQIQKTPNDFFINLAFQNDTHSFKEFWMVYPYKMDNTLCSSFVIESKPLLDIPSFLKVMHDYGFTFNGQFYRSFSEEYVKDKLIGYMRKYISDFTKYKVSMLYDNKRKCLLIMDEYTHTRSTIKVIFLSGGYWFIPTIPKNDSYEQEMCKTIKHSLDHYELNIIFGQKK
ncbi:hypothetical protein MZM54_04355 [[Brevibacterium] frigoritolerans]|nr:hypothetical protein [Peribacillus frigoritolerans]